MKRRISLLFVLIMLTLVIPCTSFAASDTVQSGNFKFTISNGTATLTKYLGDAKKVTIPKSVKGATVKYIGGKAFAGNKTIEEVTIPASVVKIKNGTYNSTVKGAFSNCTNLKKVVIPKKSKLKVIGEWSFYKAKNLTSITLPSTIRRLELSCFEGCSSLEKLNMPEGLNYIAQNALSGTGLKTLHIPKSLKEFMLWNDMPNLEKFTVAKGHSVYRTHEGVLYDRYETCSLVYYPAAKKSTAYKVASFADQVLVDTLGDDVKYLETLDIRKCLCTGAYMESDGACRVRCTIKVSDSNPYYKKVNNLLLSKDGKTLEQVPSSLEGTVIVPDGVEKIASYAAEHGNYTEIVLPETLEEIGGAAFWQSEKLEKIFIPYGVKKIGNSTFQDCSNLKEITIPNGIKTIEVSTFLGCDSLKTVTLPKSVKSVKWQAFSVCAELTVNYTGTKEQWKQIKFESDNSPIKQAKKNFSYVICQSHTWGTKYFTNKTATMKRNGEKSKHCIVCGKIKSDSVKSIAKIKTVKLKKSSYKYNGKKKNPVIIIKDNNGNSLKKGRDYTVTVPKGRKNVGTYTYTIKFKGNYSGTKKLKMTIY